MEPIKHVGILANREIRGADAWARKAMAFLRENGAEVLLEPEMATWLEEEPSERNLAELAKRCQLVLVFGGDGTFLRSARALEACKVPLLGINMGSLGFLTVLRLADVTAALSAILAGDYRIEQRMLLKATLFRDEEPFESYTALNDAVMHTARGSRLTEFIISVGGQYLGNYRADGLIVATPTGSTAYSMSAGGPIIHPTMNALVATPISPHALAIRPIVVGGEEQIEVQIGDRSGLASISLDGMVEVLLQQGDEVRIRRADCTQPVLFPLGFGYYSLVREKLRWGGPELT
ncbi:MAG: NAD(+)/NADH kinase [Candidatus Krumholzibacteriota bacterium]|nr:NAD(+)/NADH kinase [Candidatus Krumholzibacteriota bacterium]